MVELPKSIQELFYDPDGDSITSIIKEITKAHTLILDKTNTSRGTLAPGLSDRSAAIHDFTIPTNGVSKESIPGLVADLFNGVSRWHSPRTMYNVAPPPVLPTVVGKTFTALYNPNLVLDTASGESMVTEQKVIKAVAGYVGWDKEDAGGIFTFGGKATTIYGLKLGLKKCSPDSYTKGVKDDVVVLSTNAGHPSHISDAGWLGIGTENVMRLKTDTDGRVDLDDLRQAIITNVKAGKKIAAIIISGGSTNNMVVDPIEQVVTLRDALTRDLNLEYTPHVHVDAVVGFPWIFFKNYDFKQNPLNINAPATKRISRIIDDLRGLYAADSFGVDFHKMGFCPYVSSLFMVKEKSSFSGPNDPSIAPFAYTIENSRSGDGPNSAFVALNVLGEVGFQTIIAHLTEVAIHLQESIDKDGLFEVVNRTGLGSSVMFVPRLPSEIVFNNEQAEIDIRNTYALRFIEKLSETGNPYYIDKVPGSATGANPYPYIALKAYIMSPHSSAESNLKFVSFMKKLKREIDKEFVFTDKAARPLATDFAHPLK